VDSAQPRFGELTVQGFRRLRDVRVALKPLSVMMARHDRQLRDIHRDESLRNLWR
jgi:hypothetical protein